MYPRRVLGKRPPFILSPVQTAFVVELLPHIYNVLFCLERVLVCLTISLNKSLLLHYICITLLPVFKSENPNQQENFQAEQQKEGE